ncbi:signal recognition particle-docking protein FtsY, partial [bacterium]|nr:signal recognition particle-docking protein FtsY [bacterium]
MFGFIRRRRDKKADVNEETAVPATVEAVDEQSDESLPVSVNVEPEQAPEEDSAVVEIAAEPVVTTDETTLNEVAPAKSGMMGRLAQRLSKTGRVFSEGLGTLLLGKKEIDDELLEEIETQLLMADVGIETTNKIVAELTGAIDRDGLTDANALYKCLQQSLEATLAPSDAPFVIDCNRKPYVILVVGV